MGAYKDHLDLLRATVNGLVPFGGTLNPVSEGIPVAFAQNIKGNLAVYPTLEALADIPYQVLSLDMEAIVQEHVRPDTTTHERTRYRLIQLPTADTKVSDVVDYVITDYWEVVVDGGEPGSPGDKGWTALYTLEDDGPTRVVERFFAWIGGTGSQPPSPSSPEDYRGLTGFVTKSLAINVKGPAGPAGSAAQVRPDYYVTAGTRRLTPPATNMPLVAAGTFSFASNPLEIVNTWTAERTFMIFGEVPFSNDSGADSWVVRLIHRANGSWGGPTEPSSARMDENYGRADFVNAAPYQSVHKVNVRGAIVLAPGQSRFFRLVMAQTNGGSSKYSDGFIEAFGI